MTQKDNIIFTVSKTMKKKLLECIKYWESEHAELVEHGIIPCHGGNTCALCVYIGGTGCGRCIINRATDNNGCSGVPPYEEWEEDPTNGEKHLAMIDWMTELYSKCVEIKT